MAGIFDLNGTARARDRSLERARAALRRNARRRGREDLARGAARERAGRHPRPDPRHGGDGHSVVMDVTDAASIERALDAAEERFGPVQVLVNNAGVTVTRPALELEERDWDQVVDTNLKGVWLAAQGTAKRMVRHGSGGSIVNIASILGLRVAGAVAPYAVSKAGVVQLTKASRSNGRATDPGQCLAPGYVQTELNADFFESDAGKALIKRVPQRRLGEAHELDGALLLLASDASTYMTGSVIAVDGGHLVSSL